MPGSLDELSPADLLARGDAFLRALSGEDETLPVAAFVGLAQEELREALARRNEAAARSEVAYRACDAADQRLDATIADLSLLALDLGGGDTRAPLFFRLFPDGPQAYTCAPLEKEVALVADLREQLVGHPLRERFDGLLQQRAGELKQGGASLARALEEEALAWARLRRAEMVWRLRARLARSALERQLAGEPERLATIDRIVPLPERDDAEALQRL